MIAEPNQILTMENKVFCTHALNKGSPMQRSKRGHFCQVVLCSMKNCFEILHRCKTPKLCCIILSFQGGGPEQGKKFSKDLALPKEMSIMVPAELKGNGWGANKLKPRTK